MRWADGDAETDAYSQADGDAKTDAYREADGDAKGDADPGSYEDS